MNNTKKTLIGLFLLIFIVCTLVQPVFAQENSTNIQNATTQNATLSEAPRKGELTKEDIIIEAQRSFDRSLGILNTVTTAMGNLVGLITIILGLTAVFVSIAIALGVFQINRWRKIGQEAEKKLEEIAAIKQRGEEYLNNLSTKEFSQASLIEKVSEETKKKLDELTSKLDLLEIMGVSLKSEDYYTRGITHYYKGEYELALKAFEEAIKIKPDYAKAWINKSAVLGSLGRYEEAFKAAEKAIEIKPDDTLAWNNKSAALIRIGRYEEALKAAEKAIEIEPDNANAWSNESGALYHLSRYEEALKASDKAVEIKPEQAIMWYNRASVYSVKGEKETVLYSLKKAIEIDISFKEKARKNKDFEKFWEDEGFKKLVE